MERYLVTIIKKDDSIFTYGVTTIGGRANAIEMATSNYKSGINEKYFIYANISDEKADYEIPTEADTKIPNWINNI